MCHIHKTEKEGGDSRDITLITLKYENKFCFGNRKRSVGNVWGQTINSINNSSLN